MSKPRLPEKTLVIMTGDSYTDTYKTGDTGIVVTSMWDYPNWDYYVRFTSGRLDGRTGWVYDCDLQEQREKSNNSGGY